MNVQVSSAQGVQEIPSKLSLEPALPVHQLAQPRQNSFGKSAPLLPGRGGSGAGRRSAQNDAEHLKSDSGRHGDVSRHVDRTKSSHGQSFPGKHLSILLPSHLVHERQIAF